MSDEKTTEAPKSVEALQTGMAIKGKVKRIELYGAFVDIGVGQDALLHISQLGKKVNNVEDVIKVDDEITAFVLKVDKTAGRVAISLQKPATVSWDEIAPGTTLTGTVTRIEKFGVFVDVGAERPGLVHVSELADNYVQNPSDIVQTGQEVTVRVIKVNRKKRQIDLTMKEEAQTVAEVFADEDNEEVPTAMALAFRKAMDTQDEDKAEKSRKANKRSINAEREDILARTLREHSTN
jgi:ribosomal protein S1